MSRLPSTTALACFEAAARLGSFTRAAGELHLTQAAVSRQVIGLEQRLGTPLFVRGVRGREALALTAAGQAYLDEVRPALARIERATAGVAALKGRGGRLALSVASSLANYWLIPRLPAFTRAHGEITLDIATRVGPADFGSGGLHASLEYGDGRRPGLASAFVMPLELRPYASPAWARAFGRGFNRSPARRGAVVVPAEALIHQTTVPEAWPGWFEAAGLEPPPGPSGPRHDLMSMALNAALAGLGVALLPPYMVTDALAAGRVVALSDVRWRSAKGYHLVWPQAPVTPPAVGTLRDWLVAQAAQPNGTPG
jgi:DNA-binding transcriptional LysR family regulator